LKVESVRHYQRELAQPGIDGRSYIICAGTGKTVIAGFIISDHLQKRQNFVKKVAFVVPTRSLAEQQARKLRILIPGANVDLKIGDEARLTIKDVLPDNDVIVCTAGKLESEIKDELVTFNDLGLLVLDECHHTHKKDPHNFMLSVEFHRNHLSLPLVWLTAHLWSL